MHFDYSNSNNFMPKIFKKYTLQNYTYINKYINNRTFLNQIKIFYCQR